MKKTLGIFTLLVVMIFAALFYLGFEELRILFQKAPVQKQQTVVIEPGSPLRKIARQLNAQNILKSPRLFEVYVRVQNKMNSLQPGEYVFDVPSSIHSIVRKMQRGEVKLHRLTIPEGSTLEEIAYFADRSSVCSKIRMTKALKDSTLQQELGVPGPSFEGFLYPETYYFAKNTAARKVVKTLVKEFFDQLEKTDRDKAQQLNLNLLEWVTLASIIERESSNPSEHRIISSVFHNRLDRDMRLQSDPTVIYGIENFDGNITKKHLLTPTPYNTYTQKGLPPGPISSPSLSALKAAIDPSETDYLYFVATKQGGHYFSRTYKQHLAAVRKYQLSQ